MMQAGRRRIEKARIFQPLTRDDETSILLHMNNSHGGLMVTSSIDLVLRVTGKVVA